MEENQREITAIKRVRPGYYIDGNELLIRVFNAPKVKPEELNKMTVAEFIEATQKFPEGEEYIRKFLTISMTYFGHIRKRIGPKRIKKELGEGYFELTIENGKYEKIESTMNNTIDHIVQISEVPPMEEIQVSEDIEQIILKQKP